MRKENEKNLVEETMWSFLSMGAQKGDPERLNEYVQDFIHMAKQKNARKKCD